MRKKITLVEELALYKSALKAILTAANEWPTPLDKEPEMAYAPSLLVEIIETMEEIASDALKRGEQKECFCKEHGPHSTRCKHYQAEDE